MNHNSNCNIAIISDTHGYLSKVLIEKLKSADFILHAGDIDTPSTFSALKKMGRLIAVRGNMDMNPAFKDLPIEEIIDIQGIRFYMRHDLSRLDLQPEASNVDVLISGHTHRTADETRNGVRYINPGSASLPRMGTAPTMAQITLSKHSDVRVEWIALEE